MQKNTTSPTLNTGEFYLERIIKMISRLTPADMKYLSQQVGLFVFERELAVKRDYQIVRTRRNRELITRSASWPSSGAAAPVIVGTGASLIHVQLPSLHFLFVHAADGRSGFLFHGHFDKSESFGLSAGLVLNNGDGRYLPKIFKSLT